MIKHIIREVNPLSAELNPIRHLLALVGARHFVHVRGIRVNLYFTQRGLILMDLKQEGSMKNIQ